MLLVPCRSETPCLHVACGAYQKCLSTPRRLSGHDVKQSWRQRPAILLGQHTRPEKRTDHEVHLLGFSFSLLSHEVAVYNAVGVWTPVLAGTADVGAVYVLDVLNKLC